MTQPLGSPAAQAVLDAAQSAYWSMEAMAPNDANVIAAATLRAAADQVVPDDPDEAMHFTTEAIRLNRMGIRASLLSIASELEATTSNPLEPNDLSHLSDEEFQALAPQGFHGV